MTLPGLSSIGTSPILPTLPQRVETPATGGAGETSGFGRLMHDAVTHVEQGQQRAASSIQDLLTGKNQDILPVVAEVAEADMSFKMLMAVRNKVIEAYKQTMNMQI
jgi:flagellar hook-basal body complex protein FliE